MWSVMRMWAVAIGGEEIKHLEAHHIGLVNRFDVEVHSSKMSS